MDFKGITWAGNVYEKFEAMCLEVEEVIYEDTMKYVENQVQKVGVSVKKFYSEVMQDFLPPSCVEPVKVAAGDVSFYPCTHSDISKKPKLSILDCHGELKEKETEGEIIYGLTAEESYSSDCNGLNGLSSLCPRVLVQNTVPEVCSTKSKQLGVYRRPIGIKRISQNSHPPKISHPRTSSSGETEEKAEPSELSIKCDTGAAVNKNLPMIDAPVESHASQKKLSAESVRHEKGDSQSSPPAPDQTSLAESVIQKKDDSWCTSSLQGLPTETIGTSMEEVSPFQLCSNSRSNACEVECVGMEVIMSNEGTLVEEGSLPQLNSDITISTCGSHSIGKEVLEDSFDMEVVGNEEVGDPGGEIFEPVDDAKLEETCVIVDADKLHFISQGTEKHKSYKKKFRQALSSKLRPTRKQDQRVSDHKDLVRKSNAAEVIPPFMDSGDKRLPADDSLESDWELL